MIVSSQNYLLFGNHKPPQTRSVIIRDAPNSCGDLELPLYNSISLSLTVDLQSCEMERNSCEIGSRNGITRRRKEPPNYIIHFRDPPILITTKRVASSGHRRSINRRISAVGFGQKKKVNWNVLPASSASIVCTLMRISNPSQII